VPTVTATDPRAWRANTIDDPSTWYYALPPRCLAALDQTIRQLRQRPQETTAVRLADTPCADYRADLAPALEALEHGRGFVILHGLPREAYTAAELQTVYWLVGQLLGRPMAQNIQGTLLYDVRDTGQDVRYGARFSVTNAESTFHTDNSFGAEVLDYVGLLCLQTARSGGLSQVVSGYSACAELRPRRPEALEILARPFHIDRRGGVRPGEAPTIRQPILLWDGAELTCRYLRYWIETGHDKAGEPLTPAQRGAMDQLDAVLNEPGLRVEFNLRPGEMFFINNRWILHNRTGFEDHPEPERRRHYVRLWLQAATPDGARN
jgi:alpha-ketoglutarate-dependent taurine dioxygenase